MGNRKGPIFGMWDWNGGHGTISGLDRLRATEREQIVEERRRLEDAGRLDAKIFSDRSNSTLNDTRVARLLAALIGW